MNPLCVFAVTRLIKVKKIDVTNFGSDLISLLLLLPSSSLSFVDDIVHVSTRQKSKGAQRPNKRKERMRNAHPIVYVRISNGQQQINNK